MAETKLWLWKNFVDGKQEYWAFDNLYPCYPDGGDPMVLGKPCDYALVKESVAAACGHDLDVGLKCNRPRGHAGHHGWRAAWRASMTPPDVPAEVMAAIEAYGWAVWHNASGPAASTIDARSALVAAIAKALEAAHVAGLEGRLRGEGSTDGDPHA